MSKYEVKQQKDGKYYFHLKAPNGMVLVYSQGYASKAACYNAIEGVRKHGITEIIEDETP